MKEGDIVKINPQNNGFIGWAEFLEIIRDFGKRDPEEYYVIDILGPIYSNVHSAQDSGFSEKTINTSSLRPIPIDEELFIKYCAERCTLRKNCIKGCALIKYSPKSLINVNNKNINNNEE